MTYENSKYLWSDLSPTNNPTNVVLEDELEELRRVQQLTKETLKKKALLLARGKLLESLDEKITLKVEPTLHELYQKAPGDVRALARQAMRRALRAVVFSYWIEGWNPKQQECKGQHQVVIHLHSYEIQKEDKSQDNTRIDISPVLEKLERIYTIINSNSTIGITPKKLLKEVIDELSKKV